MRRFRVLHVIEAMHQGGAESLVVEHVRHAAPDVEPLVCALNRGGPALEAAERSGARTFLLGKAEGRIGGIARLARLMQVERVAVVNGHNPGGGLYGALAGAAAGVPVVVRTEHSVHYRGRHSRPYEWALEPLATTLTRRVVCVCEAVRQSHVSRLGWAAGRFVTVRNGVSPAPPARPRAAVRAALGLAAEAKVALAVGSLTPQKAHRLLIEAFGSVAARLPGARLLIAGEGPERASIEEQVASSRLEGRVLLLGARDDVADLMEAADLFVLSSVREGLSVTLLEAMRAGRAVVVTRAGGNAEAVAEPETGLTVPPGDPEALGEAMDTLLADPRRAAAMGAAGRERWKQGFTAARMVEETEAIYRRELGVERPLAVEAECGEGERRATA